MGKDDSIAKLKEILDDVIVKMRLTNDNAGLERILFGPDNKIIANLLILISLDPKYKKFLPEFAVLHLRKSKINTLISGYKDTGLVHLL